jgi:hypothetical protein
VSVAGDFQEFFAALAAVAAVLTGLLFAALSLHPSDLLSRQLLRNRAVGVLAGLVWVTFASLAMLFPGRFVIVVALFELAGAVALLIGNLQALRHGWSHSDFHRPRALLGDGLLVLALLGAVLLLVGASDDAAVGTLAVAMGGAAILECWQGWALVVGEPLHEAGSLHEGEPTDPATAAARGSTAISKRA